MVAKPDTDFDYHDFLLVLFDCCYSHLYPCQKNYKNSLTYLFSPSYKCTKACKIIPHLCERKVPHLCKCKNVKQ